MLRLIYGVVLQSSILLQIFFSKDVQRRGSRGPDTIESKLPSHVRRPKYRSSRECLDESRGHSRRNWMNDSKIDQSLVERLRRGDEAAFSELVDRLHQPMIRLAAVFVTDMGVAEEIVQETWLAVIDGIDNFEGRSSIKTWVFAILTNKARKRGKRDARIKAWSTIFERSIDEEVTPMSNRFDSRGRWASPPASWTVGPEERLMKDDLLAVIKSAIEALPASQRAVVRLRDVEGLSAREACDVLDISDGNQRVLLHRGRVKVRGEVETYLEQTS